LVDCTDFKEREKRKREEEKTIPASNHIAPSASLPHDVWTTQQLDLFGC
jgi:hypothetical protein